MFSVPLPISLLVTTLLLAGSELLLEDGRVLKGTGVYRDGGVYVLELDSGGSLTIPIALVKEVRLEREEEKYVAPVQVAGQAPPPGPTGILHPRPQQIDGPPVKAPKTSEQLAVFGEPSKFQKGVIDPTWTPTSDWSNDLSQNNFAPSTWSKGVIDPNWEPESAFEADKDVLESGHSTFRKSIVDSSWQPTDGFSK